MKENKGEIPINYPQIKERERKRGRETNKIVANIDRVRKRSTEGERERGIPANGHSLPMKDSNPNTIGFRDVMRSVSDSSFMSSCQ